jgi:hypothetical protein
MWFVYCWNLLERGSCLAYAMIVAVVDKSSTSLLLLLQVLYDH